MSASIACFVSGESLLAIESLARANTDFGESVHEGLL
jgi:hypothetical protein